jgi:uncharacterized phage-like protein YoqJ
MVTIAHTGHRPAQLDGDYSLTSTFWKSVEEALVNTWDGILADVVLTGMALGFDTLVAEVAARSGVPFIACVPFVGQEQRWPKESKERYARLLSKAKEIVVVCEGGYAAWKMQRRNEYMVDRGDLLIALWNGTESGGTWNAVEYARKKDVDVWRMDPTRWLS